MFHYHLLLFNSPIKKATMVPILSRIMAFVALFFCIFETVSDYYRNFLLQIKMIAT